jgi:uncharacterized protein
MEGESLRVSRPRRFVAQERIAYDSAQTSVSSQHRGPDMLQLLTIPVTNPDSLNFILGQTHFIKSVEDIHEALFGSVSDIKFGLAFCEASGKRLVRRSGTDVDLTRLACDNAMAIGAGHSFIVFLAQGIYPLNVLNAIKTVPEVCSIFCATANPAEIVVAETDQGRSIVGVVDGSPPLGVESDDDIQVRKALLRDIGYKG